MRFAEIAVFSTMLVFGSITGAVAEGSGPGASWGGMEGGAQSEKQGGENGAEIEHPENTGSGIVRGHAADTGPGNPLVHDEALPIESRQKGHQ